MSNTFEKKPDSNFQSCRDCGSLDTALNRLLQVISGFNNYLYFSLLKRVLNTFYSPALSSPRFHESPMTQTEAKKFCEEEQEVPARLVEIDSAEENSAISAEIKRRDFVSRKIDFWLGITDRHSEGHWVLESTGKSVVFTDWHSGEPNNAGISGTENCAYINSHHKWNDVRCNDNTWLTALCEM